MSANSASRHSVRLRVHHKPSMTFTSSSRPPESPQFQVKSKFSATVSSWLHCEVATIPSAANRGVSYLRSQAFQILTAPEFNVKASVFADCGDFCGDAISQWREKFPSANSRQPGNAVFLHHLHSGVAP